MASKRQNAKLGIFFVVTTVVFALVLAFVGGMRFWATPNLYYLEAQETVAGIGPDSPVTMYGVPVGEVESVELDREDFDSVRITLAIDEDVPVPAGTKVYLRNRGLTGVKQVDLAGGDISRGVVPAGSVLPLERTAIDQLQDTVKEVLPQFQHMLAEGDRLVTNLAELSESVQREDVRRLVGQSDALVQELLATTRATRATIDAARPRLLRVMSQAETTVADSSEALAQVEGAVTEIESLAANADTLVQEVRQMVHVNQDDLRAAMYNLRRTTHNAELLSRELREQPSRLLFSDPPEPRELP